MSVTTDQGHKLDTIPSAPDSRDLTYAASLGRLAPPPKSARIAAIDRTPVLDQLDLGSCTSNASVGARALFLPSYVALSRLMHYYLERQLEGSVNQDSGASVRDAGKVLQKYGACPESEDPYVTRDFRTPPYATGHGRRRRVSHHGVLHATDDDRCAARTVILAPGAYRLYVR